MKNFKRAILLFMAVVAISFTSCSNDDDGGNGGGAASGTIAAKVSGVADFMSDPIITTAVKSDGGGTSSLTITGNTMNGRNISLSIMGGFQGVGTYGIGGGANVFGNASYTETDLTNPTNPVIWVAPYDTVVAGEIKVSEISDTNIKGTFYFKGKNADGNFKDVTEGAFDVDF